MAMGITQAFDIGTTYLFRVHLDTVQVLESGAPDPLWIFECVWSKEKAPMTQAEWLAKCKVEFELLAADELVRRTPSVEISLPI